MKKKDFYTKIILYILIILIPLTLAGVMMIALSDSAGMVIGGVAMLAVDVYFGVRLYGFIKENKDMLI